jgi:hypothetical protein
VTAYSASLYNSISWWRVVWNSHFVLMETIGNSISTDFLAFVVVVSPSIETFDAPLVGAGLA